MDSTRPMAFFQFSLRRLLIGVTVVCVVCASAVAFPVEALAIGGFILPCIPAALVALTLSRRSKDYARTFVFSMMGGLFGFLFLTPLLPTWGIVAHLAGACFWAAFGALVVGIVVVSIEYAWRSLRR